LITENVEATAFRLPGGPRREAAVLTPLMAVITVAGAPGNNIIKGFLQGDQQDDAGCFLTGVKNYCMKGISDKFIEQKNTGIIMHRRENRLVYYGVLNISEDPGIFERYLKHPGREPDYRLNRRHSEFVTSLKNEGYNITFKDIAAILNSYRNFIVPLNNYSTAYDRQ
jgi:lipoate-protein ligase A